MTPVAAVAAGAVRLDSGRSRSRTTSLTTAATTTSTCSSPKSERKLSAKLSAVSPRHDVAMIKVDSPGTVPGGRDQRQLRLHPGGRDLHRARLPGHLAAGLRHRQVAGRRSTPRRRASRFPTRRVTVGNIGRVYRSQEGSVGARQDDRQRHRRLLPAPDQHDRRGQLGRPRLRRPRPRHRHLLRRPLRRHAPPSPSPSPSATAAS